MDQQGKRGTDHTRGTDRQVSSHEQWDPISGDNVDGTDGTKCQVLSLDTPSRSFIRYSSPQRLVPGQDNFSVDKAMGPETRLQVQAASG